jgi:hypothetical protein
VYYGRPGDSGRPIEAGDVICLFAGVPHAYAPAARDRWDEINVDFVGRVFDAWRGPGLLDPADPIRHLEPVAYWLHQFEHLATEVAGSRGGHGLRDAGRLIDLIGRMADDWRPDADKETSEWIEAAKDRLDPAGLERLVHHVVGGGVHGLFLLGTTGEGPALSGRLQRELIEQAVTIVAGRVPMLLGITDAAAAESIHLAGFADFFAAVQAADAAALARARERVAAISRLYRIGRLPGGIIVGIKAALAALGICRSVTAGPFEELDAGHRREVERLIADLTAPPPP